MPESRVACAVCGVEFTPKRKWAAFCSAKCRYAAWARLHPRGAIVESVRGEVGPAPIVAQKPANAVLLAVVPQVNALEARVALLERRPPVSVLPARAPSSPATWKHGANCYRNHGCRCETCVTGMRAAGRARKRRKL